MLRYSKEIRNRSTRYSELKHERLINRRADYVWIQEASRKPAHEWILSSSYVMIAKEDSFQLS